MIRFRRISRRWVLILGFALTTGLAKQPPPFDADAFLTSLNNEQTTFSRDLTMDLLWLAHYGTTLPTESQTLLHNKGFRLTPTRTTLSRSEADGLDQYLDTPFFRIHYTLTGINAVSSTDNDGNSLPDYVDLVASVFDSIYSALVQDMDYISPPGDDWVTTDNGGNGLYDIYLRNIYPGYYGYTQSEYFAQGTGDNEHSTEITEYNALTSYMALRNNYSGFPNNASQNIRVTAAHEFFHAIQFGYDGYEEIWLLEATAVWMEEVMYDQINDCYQYMPPWFQSPQTSLDAYGTHMYGSYIFFRYLEENWNGKASIRGIFESSIAYNSQNGTYDFRAIQDGLAVHNLDFQDVFNGMVIANRILSPSISAANYRYREAPDYPVNGPAIRKTVYQDTSWTSYELRRYSSEYFDFNIDHPVRIRLSTPDGNYQNVKAIGIVKTSPESYTITQGWDFILPSRSYAEWISLALSAQDTVNGRYGYTVTVTRAPEQDNVVVIQPPFPNPGGIKTGITFTIQVNDLVKINIRIVNIAGQYIANLFQGIQPASQLQFTWTGLNNYQTISPSGIYFFIVETPDVTVMKKFTWIK